MWKCYPFHHSLISVDQCIHNPSLCYITSNCWFYATLV
jgi:hypothetical protein